MDDSLATKLVKAAPSAECVFTHTHTHTHIYLGEPLKHSIFLIIFLLKLFFEVQGKNRKYLIAMAEKGLGPGLIYAEDTHSNTYTHTHAHTHKHKRIHTHTHTEHLHLHQSLNNLWLKCSNVTIHGKGCVLIHRLHQTAIATQKYRTPH